MVEPSWIQDVPPVETTGDGDRMVDYALRYACWGWAVLPLHTVVAGKCTCGNAACKSAGKHPRTQHGVADASTDPNTIRAWFARWPDANVAIATGHAVDVLDCDLGKPGADAALEDLEDRIGKLPDTPTVVTGGGGIHVYLAHNGTGLPCFNDGRIGIGLDGRGPGGFVVAPPSLHASGRRYEWSPGLDPGAVDLAPVPEALAEACARKGTGAFTIEAATTEGPNSRHEAIVVLAAALAQRGVPEHIVRRAVEDRAIVSGIKADRPGAWEREVDNAVVSAVKKYGNTPPAASINLDTLEGVLNPDVGVVHYIIDSIVPRGTACLVASEWKTGKTICWYAAIFDALTGRCAWGQFPASPDITAAVLQFEMPTTESERRLRKLAIGAGHQPDAITQLVAEGRLLFASQSTVRLVEDEHVDAWHELIRQRDARLILVDSATAAFPGVDLNDNAQVTKALNRAFGALTAEGRSVVLLHHKRKSTPGTKDIDRHSILGAQAWGAATGAIYTMRRIADGDVPTDFTLEIEAQGSWTPTNDLKVALEVADVAGGTGTVVRYVSQDEARRRQTAEAGKQSVGAEAIADLVREKTRAPLKLVKGTLDTQGVRGGTFDRALKLAVEAGWVRKERQWKTTYLVPGEAEEEGE